MRVGLGMMLVGSTMGCNAGAEAAAAINASADGDSAGSTLLPTRYDPRQSLAPMIKAVSSAVVTVDARKEGRPTIFMGTGSAVEGMGSGFIIDTQGLVVTNHHVIEGASQVRVRLSDERRFEAEVVGSDPSTDLALLRLVDAQSLPVVTLGSSETLQVGDWVVAVGNPMGLDHSATVGIVSGKGRGSLGLYRDSYIDFLQTDADIAPGSSGGPLFNLRGEVIGINTAVGSGLRPGFAIPIDQAKRIVEQLRDHGEVARGWLGAGSGSGDDTRGAEIGRVYEGTPAEQAGLRPGDVVEAIDAEPVEGFEDLRARIGTKRPGEVVELNVRRDSQSITLRVTLGTRPQPSSVDALGLPGSFLPSFQPEPDPHGPRLGARVRAHEKGLEVVDVQQGSLASRLGLQSGDVLRELDHHPLRTPRDVANALERAGTTITLNFERERVEHSITVDR